MAEATKSDVKSAPDWMSLLELVHTSADARFKTLFDACFKYIPVVGTVVSALYYLSRTGNEEIFFMASCAGVILNQIFLFFVIYLLLSLADTHHAVCELLARMGVDLKENLIVATRLRPARQLLFPFGMCLVINVISIGTLVWLWIAATRYSLGTLIFWDVACVATFAGAGYSVYQALDHLSEWRLFHKMCITRHTGDPCPMKQQGKDLKDLRMRTRPGRLCVWITLLAGVVFAVLGSLSLHARPSLPSTALSSGTLTAAQGAKTPSNAVQKFLGLPERTTGGKPTPPPSTH